MPDPNDSPLNLAPVKLVVADRIAPFFRKILDQRKDLVLAMHVIGSAVTDDFDPDRSDINSLLVLRDMDLDFLDLLGSLCHESKGSRIGPPFLLTPKYIERWQDTSPIEILDLQLVNSLVYGSDLISGITIDRALVRLQCKRELRSRLVMLSWGYVRAAGNKHDLTELLLDSIVGLAPLLRGIFYARSEPPPLTVAPLFEALSALVGSAALSFKEVYWMKLRKTPMPVARVRDILKDYYRAIETLIDLVDRIEAPSA